MKTTTIYKKFETINESEWKESKLDFADPEGIFEILKLNQISNNFFRKDHFLKLKINYNLVFILVTKFPIKELTGSTNIWYIRFIINYLGLSNYNIDGYEYFIIFQLPRIDPQTQNIVLDILYNYIKSNEAFRSAFPIIIGFNSSNHTNFIYKEQIPCYYFDLSRFSNFDDFLTALNSKQRRNYLFDYNKIIISGLILSRIQTNRHFSELKKLNEKGNYPSEETIFEKINELEKEGCAESFALFNNDKIVQYYSIVFQKHTSTSYILYSTNTPSQRLWNGIYNTYRTLVKESIAKGIVTAYLGYYENMAKVNRGARPLVKYCIFLKEDL